MYGGDPQRVALETPESHDLAAREPRGPLGDGVQDRLQVGRRLTDDPQDLGGGGLPLQRFGQLPVPLLQLPEEAGVLDGDDRLIREALQELDLLVGEGPDLQAANPDRPDGNTLAQQRHYEIRPMPLPPLLGLADGELSFGFRREIVHVYRPSVDHGAATYRTPVDGQGLSSRREWAMGRCPTEHLTVDAEDLRIVGVAKSSRALGQCLQDTLEVGWGAG